QHGDAFGCFVSGETFAAMCDNAGFFDRGAGAQAEHGVHLLAPVRMRHADHGGLEHGRVLHQHRLDFAAVDVESAADDDVLLAIDDPVISLGVAIADIAGGDPFAV